MNLFWYAVQPIAIQAQILIQIFTVISYQLQLSVIYKKYNQASIE